jgi:hypothetical protein
MARRYAVKMVALSGQLREELDNAGQAVASLNALIAAREAIRVSRTAEVRHGGRACDYNRGMTGAVTASVPANPVLDAYRVEIEKAAVAAKGALDAVITPLTAARKAAQEAWRTVN